MWWDYFLYVGLDMGRGVEVSLYCWVYGVCGIFVVFVDCGFCYVCGVFGGIGVG